MAARDRWLDEGLDILRSDGVAGLRVDAAARRLGLTKGSFHHHFAGAPDYRRAVLERYEQQMLAVIAEVRAGIERLAPDDAIAVLPGFSSSLDLRLDAAVRGWAFEDDVARESVRRVDTARLDLLVQCWRAVLGDTPDAVTAALVPHLIAIGASVAQPAPGEDDLRAVFDLLARIAPRAS